MKIGDETISNKKPNFNNKSYSSSAKLFLILTFFILFIQLASSAEIQFIKQSSNFSQGETLIAKVSGNFLEKPTSDNVVFYRGHVRIPVVYELSEVNDDFYIYAMLTGKNQGNYSIALENVIYMQGIQESTEDIIKNFTITNNTADFSVNPGFVVQANTSRSFSLEVQNLKTSEITITIDTSNDIQSPSTLELNSGEVKQVDFSITKEEAFSEEIKMSSDETKYSIPIFITANATKDESNDNGQGTTTNGATNSGGSTTEERFKFEPSLINFSMSTNTNTKRVLYIVNLGNTEIKDLTYSIPDNLKSYIKISSPKTIEKDATERVEISIASGSEEMSFDEEITVKSKNNTEESFRIVLNFIKNYVPPVNQSDEDFVATTCVQLNGAVCQEGYECSGEVAKVKDGVCCLKPATCEQVKKGSTGKVIGWLLVLIVILLLAWFFKRYKRVRPSTGFFRR